jgi:hypothetical protein
MWEASVLAGQLLALQKGIAIGWMTKEVLIIFWLGKIFSQLYSIQTTCLSSAQPHFQSVLMVSSWARKEFTYLSLVPGLNTLTV